MTNQPKYAAAPLIIDYFGGAEMQNFTADQIRQSLLDTIDSLTLQREKFIVNPQTDFTRKKKISFRQTLLFPMIAGSDNVSTELLDFFGEDNLPRPSAMIQRRNQVKVEAFQELFYQFTQRIPMKNTFLGYQLISCDGSRLNLPYNPSDSESFIQCIEGRKGINQLHLNSLYDVLNNVFLDVELQKVSQLNEKRAFTNFLDKYAHLGQKRIYMADRGYSSYNILAHAFHNNQFFLIRTNRYFAEHLCLNKEHWLEAPSVDEVISFTIGRRITRQLKCLNNYHYLPASRTYDYIEAGSSDSESFEIRVIKFPLSAESDEYLVTNLPAYAFSLNTIKELYHLRWKEETAFRHLKYAGNLVHIHSLKKAFTLQEIYGKLTLYNFSSFIAAATEIPQRGTNKYTYMLNFTQVMKVSIRFLRGLLKNVTVLIQKFLVPVRPDRSFERNLRRQSADTLNYR